MLAPVLLVAACVSPSTPTPTPSAATVDPGSSTEPAATSTMSTDGAGWTRVVPPGPVPLAGVRDLIAVDDGFVAVGATTDGIGTPTGLHSRDGRAWLTEPIPASIGGPSSLLVHGGRIVAVGGGETPKCAHPAALDAWARDPEGAWREAPFDPIFCAGLGTEMLLDAGDGTVTLAGAGSGDQGYLFTSADGLHWTDHGPNPYRDVYPRAAVSIGNELWVFGTAPDGTLAVIHRRGEGPFDATVRLPGGPEASVLAALSFGSGPAVFVTAGDTVVLLRLDSSGAWIKVPVSGLPGGSVARIEPLAGHLVGLGSVLAANQSPTPLAWSTSDGTTWTPLPLPAEAAGATGTFTAIAASGVTVGLAGQFEDATNTRQIGVIWTAPSSILEP